MKLVVIDDHPLVRKALVSLLSNSDIEEIKEISNVEEAMSIIVKDTPEIAMIDVRLGKENGLEIVRRTKEMKLKTKFIVLTSFISQEEFLKAEEIGVDGYILKDAYPEDILYALSVVRRGKKYYDPAITEKKEDNLINTLTSREKEVLNELGKGLRNEEIANNLYISEHTVKKHVSSILAKFNLNHRSQIVCYLNEIKIS
ncbi:response regulator [Clostridium folliculivorans]|uniref:response regulator n=1 Tax=Clostridium folliculivorans TaxID=2886038 RepID=UPI0021C2A5FD|nr:response regulator transcription factor [Clostridium folliculivorans]GKU31616.1 DNA-binding response regulator [Clostridium folliculivorans]